MKAWTSATIDGRCSYDWKHHWKAGDRIFRLQGTTWTKDFCASCGLELHAAPPDTGEILDLESAPSYPKPLKALAEAVAAKILPFDAKVAAAGKDNDPLFDEPFEEAQS